MAGENRVQRLCTDHGIWSVFSKKRGLNRSRGHRSTTTWWNGISSLRHRTNCG
jgi:hypothetical protein